MFRTSLSSVAELFVEGNLNNQEKHDLTTYSHTYKRVRVNFAVHFKIKNIYISFSIQPRALATVALTYAGQRSLSIDRILYVC